MTNPLLTPTALPAFSKIEPQYIESAIKHSSISERAIFVRFTCIQDVVQKE